MSVFLPINLKVSVSILLIFSAVSMMGMPEVSGSMIHCTFLNTSPEIAEPRDMVNYNETTSSLTNGLNNKSLQVNIVSTDTLKYCITQHEIGVGGYDLISYFEKNSAELGSPDYQYSFDGVVYYFVNLEHVELFSKTPEKYLPAFGGWCSMTLAMGRATTPTYDNFQIVDERLYLFEKTLSINGRTLWAQSPKTNEQLAKKNYQDYLDDGQINPDE